MSCCEQTPKATAPILSPKPVLAGPMDAVPVYQGDTPPFGTPASSQKAAAAALLGLGISTPAEVLLHHRGSASRNLAPQDVSQQIGTAAAIFNGAVTATPPLVDAGADGEPTDEAERHGVSPHIGIDGSQHRVRQLVILAGCSAHARLAPPIMAASR